MLEVGAEYRSPSSAARLRVVETSPELRLELPRATPHRDPWNESGEEACLHLSLEPRVRLFDIYFASLGTWLERGELNEQDEFKTLQLFSVLHAAGTESFASGPPVALQKLVIPVGTMVGRLLGIRPVVPG